MANPGEAVRLYSVRDAAAVLGVGKDYVYERIKDGSLGFVDLGTTVAKRRIRADVLQAFIDARTFDGTVFPSPKEQS